MSDQTKKHAHAATAALRGAGFPSLKTTGTAEVVGIFTSHIKPAHIDAWTDQQPERTVWRVKLLVPETSIPNGSRLYTAPPVPHDVAMAFGVEVAELCARHWTSGNCEELAIAMCDDISAIADHYAAQPSAATTTQLSGNSGQLPAGAVPDATKLTRYSSTTLRGGISGMEPNPHGAYVKLVDVNAMLASTQNPAAVTCENGQPDRGPVAHHDIEGVPLCARCWQLEPDACTPTSPSRSSPTSTPVPSCVRAKSTTC